MNSLYVTVDINKNIFNILLDEPLDVKYSIYGKSNNKIIKIYNHQSNMFKKEIEIIDTKFINDLNYIKIIEKEINTIDFNSLLTINYEIEIKLKLFDNVFISKTIEYKSNSNIFDPSIKSSSIDLSFNDFIIKMINDSKKLKYSIRIYEHNGNISKQDIYKIQNIIKLPVFLQNYMIKNKISNKSNNNLLLLNKQLTKNEFKNLYVKFNKRNISREIHIENKDKKIIKYLGTKKPLTQINTFIITSGILNNFNIIISDVKINDKDITIDQSIENYIALMKWEIDLQNNNIKNEDNFIKTINLIVKRNFQKNDLVSNAKLLSDISEDTWIQTSTNFEIECEVNEYKNVLLLYEIDKLSKMIFSNYEVLNVLEEIKTLLNRPNAKTVKQLTNQATSLDIISYNNIYPIVNWYVSEKVDGVHILIYISDNKINLLESISEELGEINNNNIYLFEGEKVTTKDNKTLLLIFDILTFESKNLIDLEFYKRIEFLKKAVELLEPCLDKNKFLIKHKIWEKIENKNDIKIKLEKVYNSFYNYKNDGIIFMESDKKYYDGLIYKWKPINLLTIDFLLKKCPKKMLGVIPYLPKERMTLYWLCCGIRANIYVKLNKSFPPGFIEQKHKHKLDNYFPIVFSPPSDPLIYMYYNENDNLEDKIVELSWDNMLNTWKFERIREDRTADYETGSYFGNDYRIAELNWLAIKYPLSFEDLYKDRDESYFKEIKLDKYNVITKYNSFIKSNILELYCKKANWVIDLASGKGQDLYKYTKADIKHLTMIEIDEKAIVESLQRRFNSKENLMDITSIQGDLNNTEDVMKKIINLQKQKLELNGKSVDVIVCNFAIHYFIKNISGLASMISSLLKKDGYFIFTSFNGKEIFNLLKDLKINESWSIVEDNEIKYKIQKRYDNNKFEKCGQKIGVLLPFSKNELYEEELVNLDYLNSIFQSVNLKKVITGSFNPNNISKELQVKFPSFIYELSDGDKSFVNLYSYSVYVKTKDSNLAEDIINKKVLYNIM